jgi:hypothetical protein
LTVPPGFSQSATPFIAFWCQGIPHTPLVAWPHCSHPPTTCRHAPVGREMLPATSPPAVGAAGVSNVRSSSGSRVHSHTLGTDRCHPAAPSCGMQLDSPQVVKDRLRLPVARPLPPAAPVGRPVGRVFIRPASAVGQQRAASGLVFLGARQQSSTAAANFFRRLEMTGLEPVTSWLQTRRSPS